MVIEGPVVSTGPKRGPYGAGLKIPGVIREIKVVMGAIVGGGASSHLLCSQKSSSTEPHSDYRSLLSAPKDLMRNLNAI